jgi:hypothetical protein
MMASCNVGSNPTCENEMMPLAPGNSCSNDFDPSLTIKSLKCALPTAMNVFGEFVWKL